MVKVSLNSSRLCGCKTAARSNFLSYQSQPCSIACMRNYFKYKKVEVVPESSAAAAQIKCLPWSLFYRWVYQRAEVVGT